MQAFVRNDTRLVIGFYTTPSQYGFLKLTVNGTVGADFQFITENGEILDKGYLPCKL